MKKTIILFVILLASFFASAANFVMIPYSGSAELNKLFGRTDITIHYYNDNQVFASSDAFDANTMVLIDANAFDGFEAYYLVYCPEEQQDDYLVRHNAKALLRETNYVVLKGGEVVPAKNDGMIAIFNRVARLPRLTREFPNVTEENPDIRYLLDQVSQDSMHATVRHMQDYGGRKWNSAEVLQCEQWIVDKFEALGLEVSTQAVTYNGNPTSDNVIAIQRGTLYPDVYVVCGSHYDSYSYSGNCPGADDNATGTASVLETARILSQYDMDYSIIYCTFSCEEMGLIGSAVYARSCADQGMNIIGYFNNDMNGYLYGDAIHIHQIYPSSAEACGAYYRNVGSVYFPDMVIEHKNFSSGDSDHTSFNNNGYQGIYPFEDVDHYSPYIHSPNDTIGLSVNSFAMGQRYCQMNMACLCEIANPHPRGPVVLKDYAIISDGDNDGKMNPGEEIGLSVTMKNNFDTAVNDVQVTLSSDSPYITITDAVADFGNFAAGEEKSLENAFSFNIAANAPAPAIYIFTAEAVSGAESCTTSFKIQAYGSKLEYVGIVVLDDDGLLNPGETANLRFLVENVGNEFAKVSQSTLTSTSEHITINSASSPMSRIIAGGMGYADFNVTRDADATINDFPMTWIVEYENGDTTHFNCVYNNNCNVVFSLSDSYGDGWNGAAIIVSFDDGTPSQNMTISSGSSASYTINIASGTEVSLAWQAGQYDNECSFSVAYENGAQIYSGSGSHTGTFFTWTNDCSGGGSSPEFCGAVRNLSVVPGTLQLVWEAPTAAVPDSYNIYYNTVLLGNTTELFFTDTVYVNVYGVHNYFVYPVFDDCEGEVAAIQIYYDPLQLSENETSQIKVFPNPGTDNLSLSASVSANDASMLQIFDFLGRKVFETRLLNGTVTIDTRTWRSGLYFWKLGNETGKWMKR